MAGIEATIIDAANEMPRRPSLPARLMGALPLFFFYFLFALALIASPNLEKTFKEMDIGALPAFADMSLNCASFARQFWFLTCPIMFVVSYVYFVWGCVSVRRMMWCAFASSLLCFLTAVTAILTYVLPMIGIMERIGK